MAQQKAEAEAVKKKWDSWITDVGPRLLGVTVYSSARGRDFLGDSRLKPEEYHHHHRRPRRHRCRHPRYHYECHH